MHFAEDFELISCLLLFQASTVSRLYRERCMETVSDLKLETKELISPDLVKNPVSLLGA